MAACGTGGDEAKAQDKPRPCCPRGSLPEAYDKGYKPRGKTIDMGPTAKNTYVTGDPKWGTAVVVFHDVYGANSGDHYAFCDRVASAGYYVLLPDFYKGQGTQQFYDPATKQPVLEKPEAIKFLQQADKNHVFAVLKDVNKHLDDVKIRPEGRGTMGFCWGAWAQSIIQNPKMFQAQVWFHPSLVVDTALFNGLTQPELIELQKIPTLICPSKNEPKLYSDGTAKKILDKNNVPNDEVLFPNQSHGWVVRGAGFLGTDYMDGPGFNIDNLGQLIGVSRALDLGVGWMARHLFPKGS